MKNIVVLLLLLITFNAASQNFEKYWDKVVSYEREGKIKSANKIVKKIRKKALSNKSEVELIKCFFYTSKYTQVLEENAQVEILNNLNNEAQGLSIPTRAIMAHIYSKCLQDYYKKHKYKIRRRFEKLNSNDDFETWSEGKFKSEITRLIAISLANQEVLEATNLSQYERIFDLGILDKQENTTLYDFLLNEVIAYYSKSLSTSRFKSIDYTSEHKRALFSDSNDFIKLDISFIENEDLNKVLSYYQIKESRNPSLANQFQRIKFCYKYLISDSIYYLKTLDFLQKKTNNNQLIQNIQWSKAKEYARKASKKYNPNYYIKSIAVLDSVLAFESNSNAYKLAVNKKSAITSKKISVKLQRYIYNNENTRAFVKYRNMNHFSAKFFKMDHNKGNNFYVNGTDLTQFVDSVFTDKRLVAAREYSLPDKKDYFEYSTEVLLPQLETGTYFVYFETDVSTGSKKANSYQIITVTNLTVHAVKKDDTDYYHVLDRKTGMPLSDVTIESNCFKVKTNNEGLATYRNNEGFIGNDFQVYSQKDTLNFHKGYLNRVFTNSEEDSEDFEAKAEIYLDRAIYRPGQTVYYKCIVVKKKKNKSTVVKNTPFLFYVEDSDWNDIIELEVVTDEYGSFSGEFVLPKSGNMGEYTIYVEEPDDYEEHESYNKEKDEHWFWDYVDFEDGEKAFRVEEYKRPKFEVKLDPMVKSYQLNQNIEVTGKAISFAGSNITDAVVEYTVTRSVKTYSWYSYRENVVITTGEAKTDDKGNFSVFFDALPDLEYEKEDLPVFNYKVNVTVKDINGETHETETTVKLGYHALDLKAFVPHKVMTDEKQVIELSSTNLNGEFVACMGEVKIYLLQEFLPKFKDRVWEIPEIKSISDNEFNRLFPYEKNTLDNLDIENGKLLFTKKVNTLKDKKIVLDFISKYKSGDYKVIFTSVDKFNNTIKTSKGFKIYQSKDKVRPNGIISAKQINDDPKKDGFIKLAIRSSVQQLYINATANCSSKERFFDQSVVLENNKVLLRIPIDEITDRTVQLGFQVVFENETFNEKLDVFLKGNDPKLELNIESFRNKIRPGEQEKWSFSLDALHTSKEAAVLASMYDSSLDAFAQDDWDSLVDNERSYSSVTYRKSFGYGKVYTSIKNLNPPKNNYEFQDEETQLLWFGFNFNAYHSYHHDKKYKKQLNKKAEKPKNAKLITGIVSDETGPLPGVNIIVAGTQRGTATDFDGEYVLEAAIGEKIEFTYLGYKTYSVVANTSIIDVVLEEDAEQLSEVIVVGYGSVKKEDATGSVSVVTVSDFNLSGKVSGIVIMNKMKPLYIIDGLESDYQSYKKINLSTIIDISILKGKEATNLYGKKGKNGVILITTKEGLEALSQVEARTNLSETAFFYPNLMTDDEGKVKFEFISPEALTTWKMRLLAHNQEGVSGYLEKYVVTQKELMVMPNFPRFFREKDSITITTKIANLTDKSSTGMAMLQLYDAVTGQPIDDIMNNRNSVKNFRIKPKGNTAVSWQIFIPEGVKGVQYKVVAKAGNYSDGEENILPVLTNTILITESIPLWVRGKTKKEYVFENLKSNTSSILKNHQFTLEYTSNPAWMAIQSLPYLMEYEHECAEQTFARYYANALATEIIGSNPKIETVFKEWREHKVPDSKLSMNDELKSIILSETPWFHDMESEQEKKKKLALLFDLEKMKNAQMATFNKLKQKQKSSGGFAWFEGGQESVYITRHILSGIGHLSALVTDLDILSDCKRISKKGIPFIDSDFIENYKEQVRLTTRRRVSYSDLHFLYMRSFYLKQYPLSKELDILLQAHLNLVKSNWLGYSLYQKGMAALVLNRFGEKKTAKQIIEHLKETSSNNEDWGMYWIANKGGWYWHQAPIETQSLLIEAFSEVTNDVKSVDAMKVWLIKNKKTNNWPTTKATTEAIYALLMTGSDWLSVKDKTTFTIGDTKILSKKLSEAEKESEAGYIKINWESNQISKDMATVTVNNKSEVPGYGGVYWQYFENLDVIKNQPESNLTITKKLYLKTTQADGEVLQDIIPSTKLKIGDLVTVQVIIKSKENVDYIHLKDMRASCFEPIDVLSGYEYNDGIGYYKSTKDAATHFFFDRIKKGTYVLEYDMRVNSSGDFSNGISTIQSMYAPEFSSHTEGIRVKVKE